MRYVIIIQSFGLFTTMFQATVRLHSCCMMTCTLNGGPEVGAETRPANGTKGNTTAVAIYNATEAATEATAEVVQAAVQPLTEALQAVASIANSALEAVGRKLHDIVFEDRE